MSGYAKKLKLSKELLTEMYKTSTIQEISEELGVSYKTIQRRFREYDINSYENNPAYINSLKPKKRVKLTKVKKYTNKEDFEEVYSQVKSLVLVAKHYKISLDTAFEWKKKHNIATVKGVSEMGMNMLNKDKPWVDKETLSNAYDNYSIKELTELWGCNKTTIHDWLNKFEIPRKTSAEQWERKSKNGNVVVSNGKFQKNTYLDIYKNEGRITTKMKEFIVKTIGKCQCCDYDEVLDLHHIDENHNNNDPYNHLVICPNCHAKIHRLGFKCARIMSKLY